MFTEIPASKHKPFCFAENMQWKQIRSKSPQSFAQNYGDFPKLQPQCGAIGNLIKHDSLLNPKSPWTFLKA